MTQRVGMDQRRQGEDRTGYCIFIVVTRVGAIKASDCRNTCAHNDQTTKRLSVPCAPDPLKAGKKISMELAKTSTDSTYNKYCGHCKQYLQERTFRNHKQKYYNKTTGKWQQESSKPALTTAGSGIEIQDPFADIGSDDTGSDVAEPSCEIPPSDHQSDPTDHDASSAPETASSEESDIHGSEEDTDDNGSGEGEEEWERSDEEQQLLRDLYSSAVQAAEPQTKAARPDPVVTVRIHGRMVYGETVIDGRKMLVVSPVSRKAFL
ncbi:hypothetical protein Bbelb_254670 [Branchiostoma belcheri]|nr:hypothetical protein Bbelb_254670 [Branchiostoma belcheri]